MSTGLGNAGGTSGGFTRRYLLKSLFGTTALAAFPAAAQLAVVAFPAGARAEHHSGKPLAPVNNPAWYGFNLLEYFSTDPDWMKYFPYRNDGLFLEDDFRWIRDWGFNFVRLPMDYRFWTDPADVMKIYEQKVEPIDRAIHLGEKYGLHVNICLHRAPGYCVLDDLDPSMGVIPAFEVERGNVPRVHVTVEKTDLFRDSHALEAFVNQRAYFARRYKGIPGARLSFTLLCDPNIRLTPEERQAMQAASRKGSAQVVTREIEMQKEKRQLLVVRSAIDVIRTVDPARSMVSDGYTDGALPIPELIGTGVVQSTYAYMPRDLTLYKAEWLPAKKNPPRPDWPLTQGRSSFDRGMIEQDLHPWRAVEQAGAAIHIGEMGCYKYTPHAAVMGWFKDTLEVLSKMQCGWALRNFRGPFGVLDTERKGTKFKDWHGHQLDQALLTVLQKRLPA